MKLDMNTNRRGFLKGAGIGLGSMVLMTVTSARGQLAESLQSTISDNHGHVFSISLSTLIANGPQKYSIEGVSGHVHTIEVTELVLATLRETKVVEIVSTVDFGHGHLVRLRIV